MSHLTPIGSRLTASLNEEYMRMQNEWFFKWHSIGSERGVEIESFNGRPIFYGGIRFSGSAHRVYWDTIQRYLQKKVGSIFDELEGAMGRYPLDVRSKALDESKWIVGQFAAKIRRTAIEKDRVLRGNGIEFPPEHDLGHWHGCRAEDIEARVGALRQIYCDLQIDVGGASMPFRSLMKDRLTLVKKDGTIVKSDIQATVSSNEITTFDSELPIEVGDSFLRKLPNGLVENYIVSDPGYHSGISGAIQPHYQVKVRRSDAPPPQPQSITANFHGPNSRMNVNSVDASINVVSGIQAEQLSSFVAQVKGSMAALPPDQQERIAGPLLVLEAEATSTAPSQSKIRSALLAIKTVTEGAAGNLVASGIGALIGQMLGGG
jgi:hypothetical protein